MQAKSSECFCTFVRQKEPKVPGAAFFAAMSGFTAESPSTGGACSHHAGHFRWKTG